MSRKEDEIKERGPRPRVVDNMSIEHTYVVTASTLGE